MDVDRFVCPECGKAYGSAATLKRHRKNHAASPSHRCSICDASFRRRDLLNRHLVTHRDRPGPAGPRARRPHRSACIRCVKRKTSCNGGQPCARCAKAGDTCHYQNQDGTDMVLDGSHPTTSQPESADGLAPAASVAAFPLATDDALAAVGDTADYSAALGPMGASMDPFNEALISAESGGWPWLFESLYLRPTDLPDLPYTVPSYDLATAPAGSASDFPMATPRAPRVHNPVPTASALPPSITSRAQASDDQRRATQLHTVEDVVQQAGNFFNRHLWDIVIVSQRLDSAYSLSAETPPGKDPLRQMLYMHRDHFNILWPLYRNEEYDRPHQLHPCIYLISAAIGARFFGTSSRLFHQDLIKCMHKHLHAKIYSNQVLEDDLEPVMIALSYLRIALLYFGHARAFSSLQMLATALIYLARRVNIFSLPYPMESSQLTKQQRERNEKRKYLAFGLLRGELWMAMLWGTRTLISPAEINMPIMHSQMAWIQGRHSQPSDVSEKLLFCDLVDLLLDPDEPLPPLDPLQLEQGIFGLQEEVWNWKLDAHRTTRARIAMYAPVHASQDASRPERGLPLDSPPASSMKGLNLLDHSQRQMKRFREARTRTFAALEKWKKALLSNTKPEHMAQYRSSLLTCHLVYHMCNARLQADVSTIHRLFLDFHQGNQNQAAADFVHEWGATAVARDAVAHVLQVRSILDAETQRPKQDRAHFNIGAPFCLFNSAAVVWAFAATRDDGDMELVDVVAHARLSLYRRNLQAIMASFGRVFKMVTVDWQLTASFERTIEDMGKMMIPGPR